MLSGSEVPAANFDSDHYAFPTEDGERVKNAAFFLRQRYFAGFLFEAEEYDLGLKRICRFKALTSSFSFLGEEEKKGDRISCSKGKNKQAFRVDIRVVMLDKITVILFVLQTEMLLTLSFPPRLPLQRVSFNG
ncbi:uncharacterized protein TNCT_476461 [Trichonephila clavata]|uniref:Uncharacterized protein n=1 Tax=Trichonephila clavata TaxID=2740835 RepID=A0A8X6L394_TRICU|nr:uncharacterized protein TNCT_476461 [Trichonephila clavata]